MNSKLHTSLFRSYACQIPKFLFFAAVMLSIGTTYYVTGHILDSDASSELVLAHHLSQIRQPFSTDWIYSTELRVLNTQLIYAPLFCFLDNWHMVRFFGTLILQTIYIASFFYLIYEAGYGKDVFYLGASLLLLPVSVTYGRIVLYHCYYIPHIALSFFILALTLGFSKETSWKSLLFAFRFCALILFSFFGGLGGVRQLMITHAPLLLSIVTLAFIQDSHNNTAKSAALLEPKQFSLLLYAFFSAFASLIGLLVNTNWLSKRFLFQDHSTNTLGIIRSEELSNILYGYFHQFGFRDNVKMISLSGILSLGGIFAGIYILILSIKKLKARKNEADIRKSILQIFFLFYSAIMFAVFFITGKYSVYSFTLYFVLCLSWAVPLLVSHFLNISHSTSFFHVKKLFPFLSVIFLLLNGLANTTFFIGNHLFEQPYEGLIEQNMNRKAEMTGVVNYLTENQYDVGYATFWECNIVTEISNGKVMMISIQFNEGTDHIVYFDWLTLMPLRVDPQDKPFLLLRKDDQSIFNTSEISKYCSLAYEDSKYCVYNINDLDTYIELVRSYWLGS